MKTFLFGVLTLLCICCCVMGQQKPTNNKADEATIRELEAKWDAAAVKADVSAYEQILADQFILTGTDGRVQTKSEFLAALKSGKLKYFTAKGEDLKVFLYGDAAVVSGRWTGKFTENGKTSTSVERYTASYARQNGQWRCTSSHSTSLKPNQ